MGHPPGIEERPVPRLIYLDAINRPAISFRGFRPFLGVPADIGQHNQCLDIIRIGGGDILKARPRLFLAAKLVNGPGRADFRILAIGRCRIDIAVKIESFLPVAPVLSRFRQQHPRHRQFRFQMQGKMNISGRHTDRTLLSDD